MTFSTNSGLQALTDDIERAILSREEGPPDSLEYREIRARLAAAIPVFPRLYRETMSEPLFKIFDEMGERGWADILSRDRSLGAIARLGLDLVQTQNQRASGYRLSAGKAFQEVVSDLYDGFLSAADRGGVKPPDYGVAPPLIKWGQPYAGPYAWTAPATALYGCGAGVVNMPPAFAENGLAAWAALGHETAGHQILHADKGLRKELAGTVFTAISGSKKIDLKDTEARENLAHYWANRIDETASDIMGVVNMGPAAALGLIAYFRGLSHASGGTGGLSAYGPAEAPHPPPLARAFVMAETLGICEFSAKNEWKQAIYAETQTDLPVKGFTLAGVSYDVAAVRAAAAHVASAILSTKMRALENHAIGEIQNWRDDDESIAQHLALCCILGHSTPQQSAFSGIFAAHAVAAALIAALISANPGQAQRRMITLIEAMHDANPSWSELKLSSAGMFSHAHLASRSESHEGKNGVKGRGGPVHTILLTMDEGNNPPDESGRGPAPYPVLLVGDGSTLRAATGAPPSLTRLLGRFGITADDGKLNAGANGIVGTKEVRLLLGLVTV